MAMIVRPTSDDGIEHAYQIALLGYPVTAKGRPDFFQKRMHVFLGGNRVDSALPRTDVLSEKIKPLLDMSHTGLVGRELQAPIPKELLDHRTDSIFQLLFRVAGDDEVSRAGGVIPTRSQNWT